MSSSSLTSSTSASETTAAIITTGTTNTTKTTTTTTTTTNTTTTTTTTTSTTTTTTTTAATTSLRRRKRKIDPSLRYQDDEVIVEAEEEDRDVVEIFDEDDDDDDDDEEEVILASNDSALVSKLNEILVTASTTITSSSTTTTVNTIVVDGEDEDGKTDILTESIVKEIQQQQQQQQQQHQHHQQPQPQQPFVPQTSSSPKKVVEILGTSSTTSSTCESVKEPACVDGELYSKPVEDFKYILDAPTACKFRKNEDPLTYINKDLFYGLSLEFVRGDGSGWIIREGSTVTSVVMMDFREQKTEEEAYKTWAFWHSRQHSDEVRILDVESKVTSGLTVPPSEVAYNAISIKWVPDQGNAYIMIAVRCLSTDFSIQKGIKGIPLQLQIDTNDENGILVHRAVCQVKVFCDKGAERKTREDMKRFLRELEKNNCTMDYCRIGQPRSVFKRSMDMNYVPTLFQPNRNPDYHRLRISAVVESPHGTIGSGGTLAPVTATMDDVLQSPPNVSPKRKRIRYRSESVTDPSRIMIYVRQENEDVFTALHIYPPSVCGLVQAITSKYQIDSGNIRFLYRRDLRGIVVKVDDDMLRYYCNEDAFLMKVLAFEEKNTQSVLHDIVLVDMKTSSLLTSSPPPPLSSSSAMSSSSRVVRENEKDDNNNTNSHQ